MKTIRELTGSKEVKELATESNRRLGKEIVAYDRIEFEKDKPELLVARVKVPTGQTRTVTLEAEGETLSWHCTCGSASGKDDVFCKHAVAAAQKLEESEEVE